MKKMMSDHRYVLSKFCRQALHRALSIAYNMQQYMAGMAPEIDLIFGPTVMALLESGV
jgi:hypothetical protein